MINWEISIKQRKSATSDRSRINIGYLLSRWKIVPPPPPPFDSAFLLTRSRRNDCYEIISGQQQPEHFAECEAGDAMDRHEGRDHRSYQSNGRHDLRRGRGLLRTGRFLPRRGYSFWISQYTDVQLRKCESQVFIDFNFLNGSSWIDLPRTCICRVSFASLMSILLWT